ncbi:hypothetical protein Dimus_026678 [Dionaea muscipula]
MLKLSKSKLPRAKEHRKKFIASLSSQQCSLQQMIPSDVPEREGGGKESEEVDMIMATSSPTATEMDEDVANIISEARQRPFISQVVVPLDILVKDSVVPLR